MVGALILCSFLVLYFGFLVKVQGLAVQGLGYHKLVHGCPFLLVEQGRGLVLVIKWARRFHE